MDFWEMEAVAVALGLLILWLQKLLRLVTCLQGQSLAAVVVAVMAVVAVVRVAAVIVTRLVASL